MTEKSFIWDAAGGGDESPHSESDTADLFAAITGKSSGVLPGVLSELTPSVNGSDIRVAIGWAIVDGHPYRNDTQKDTTVVQPLVGTTGRRLVLRCDWAAQTVRITEISSPDGTAAIPAVTQSPGSTYDVKLCSYTVSTSRVIASFVDERDWNQAADWFGSMRQAFRRGRKVIAMFRPHMPVYGDISYPPAGLGFSFANYNAYSITVTNGEPTMNMSHYGGANTYGWIASATSSAAAFVSPDKRLRMLCRFRPATAHSNLAASGIGFYSNIATATPSGAYIRVMTTGNVYFVTRQGASETATDLGNLSRTTVQGFEIETPDGGVTWYCRNQAGQTLATHMTNVPTSTTNLIYGTFGLTGPSAVSVDYGAVAHMDIEGTFA